MNAIATTPFREDRVRLKFLDLWPIRAFRTSAVRSTSASSWFGLLPGERQDAIGLPVHQQKCEECQAVIDERKGSVWYARTPACSLREPSISAPRLAVGTALEDREPGGGDHTTQIRVEVASALTAASETTKGKVSRRAAKASISSTPCVHLEGEMSGYGCQGTRAWSR
jgi:hypothetical protein